MRWNQRYAELRRKGIFIDYPPRYGTLLGFGPWNQPYEDDEDPLD